MESFVISRTLAPWNRQPVSYGYLPIASFGSPEMEIRGILDMARNAPLIALSAPHSSFGPFTKPVAPISGRSSECPCCVPTGICQEEKKIP